MGSGKTLPKLLKLCYKVSWGGKMTATQSSTIVLSVKRLKEYSFTLFHHVFWKRTIFEGVPVSGYLGTLVPKVHWGVKKMWKKLQKFLKKFGDFWRHFVSLLFQICLLRPNCFHISPLDGGPQHMFHVTLSWFDLFKVLKVCKYKCYFSWSILTGFKFKGTLVNVFQRSISHMRACFFSFMI